MVCSKALSTKKRNQVIVERIAATRRLVGCPHEAGTMQYAIKKQVLYFHRHLNISDTHLENPDAAHLHTTNYVSLRIYQ